jgi:hypothetical protein
MSHRPTLDVVSFEKLLLAAWVLQCERDRKLSELHDATTAVAVSSAQEPLPLAVSPDPTGSVSEAERTVAEAHAALMSKEVDPVVIPSPPMQIPPTAGPIPRPTEIARAPAWSRGRHWPTKPDPIPLSTPDVPKKPASERIATGAAVISRRVALTFQRLKDKERELPRLRLIIPKQAPRAVAAYAEFLVILVVIALLIAQLFSHRSSLTSVKAASELSDTAARGARDSMPESSHMRVTDPEASSVVEDLSRYEMQTVRRQAQYGDDVAALTLGMAYETGRQVPQSCTQAAHWIAVAAEEGNPAAQYNLALRYVSGDGIPTNQDEARKWFQAAARQGNQQAGIALNEGQ